MYKWIDSSEKENTAGIQFDNDSVMYTRCVSVSVSVYVFLYC